MSQIDVFKAQEETWTPLLLFECVLPDGGVERWCTHRVRAEGQEYEPRVLRHSGFEMRLGAEEGLDYGSRLTVVLSNVDGRISQVDATTGWRGSRLKVKFGFFDVVSGEPVSELAAVFAGIANPVEELNEREGRLSFLNRLGLQRLQVPSLRIQARCPWRFPVTRSQREEAVEGGADGKYSPFFRCGYSPDVAGGAGNLNGDVPFSECGYTREDCKLRGMFDVDSSGRVTARFGGFGFLPPGLWVKPHGSRESQWSDPLDGRARPNDAVPLIYGTAWIQAPVIFARNDGNLTHCEALVGLGPIEGVQKVIANGVEIPLADDGRDMSGTGWYHLLTRGERQGGFNAGFVDAEGRPLGDPHGSLACLAVVLPNQIVERGKLPKIEVLADGLRLPRYDALGHLIDTAFTRNPAWVLLDLFQMAGWRRDEIDFESFYRTAQFCDEFIPLRAPGGVETQGPRFEVNVALTKRHSLSEAVRGIRAAASLMITLDAQGRLSVRPESTLARQAPEKPVSSNAVAAIEGGWPAYEFGDGSNGISGILRSPNGQSTFRVYRRSSGESANRLTAEFADAFRNYEPDVLSLVDYRDAELQGCEVSASLAAVGLPHFDQAARILRLNLEKNVGGNQFIEFETTMRAFGLRPGDIIAVTHRREGFDRALFRILKIVAGLNFETARIIAQRHEDIWYLRAAGEQPGDAAGGIRNGGIPRSLAGRSFDAEGREVFEIETVAIEDGAEVVLRFTPPGKPAIGAPAPPSVSLTPAVLSEQGSLPGGRTLYYAITAVNADGTESSSSFTVEARLPGGASAYAVRLEGIRCRNEAAGLGVYRGDSPYTLRRIAFGVPVADSFLDDGLAASVIPAPDPNFDHARFQWRFEFLPETQADLYGARMIGNSGLGLVENEYRGAVVRITKGRGKGQERVIESHTATEILVAQPWRVQPDSTSVFTIAEASWKPAGMTRSDEIRFLVPAAGEGAIQTLGVAVSGRGVESPEGEALVGRCDLSASGVVDTDVPPMPSFGIASAGQGGFLLSGIGFPSLENTRTVRTGTLTVHYWNELESPTPWRLAAGLEAQSTVISVSPAIPAEQGDVLQIGAELLRVLEAGPGGAELLVDRGVHDTDATAHPADSRIYLLRRQTSVFAFQKGFFGSPASGSYSQWVELPEARIAAAEFYVTNDRGSSPTAFQAYTITAEGGLRTMAGGQYTIQYDGTLAVMGNLAPPVVVERTRAVRDVQAYVDQAPLGEPVMVRVLLDQEPYVDLTIAAGSLMSESVSCLDRAPLREGSLLQAAILSVGTGVGSYPGRGLTVVLRL